MREKLQVGITLLIVTTYCILVMSKVANVEGFVMLATYVVKKFLDDIEEKKGGTQ